MPSFHVPQAVALILAGAAHLPTFGSLVWRSATVGKALEVARMVAGVPDWVHMLGSGVCVGAAGRSLVPSSSPLHALSSAYCLPHRYSPSGATLSVVEGIEALNSSALLFLEEGRVAAKATASAETVGGQQVGCNPQVTPYPNDPSLPLEPPCIPL